ncbi:hypothetical protein JTB14_028568 [Gonioctena quinquepunctata]|nr:hypothetical protein JTB14_028568 [Gonioctena quinquepunctata]
MKEILGRSSSVHNSVRGLIWEDIMWIQKYKAMLESVQRTSPLRVASTKALQVITGVVLIDLLVEERRNIFIVNIDPLTEMKARVRDQSKNGNKDRMRPETWLNGQRH